MGIINKIKVLANRVRRKKINLGLPVPDTPKVVIIPPKVGEDEHGATLHLRTPIKIRRPAQFNSVRNTARRVVQDLRKSIDSEDIDTFLAAMIYEIVDQDFRGD